MAERKLHRRVFLHLCASAAAAAAVAACGATATPTTAPTKAPAAQPTAAPTKAPAAPPTATPAPKSQPVDIIIHGTAEYAQRGVARFNEIQDKVRAKAEITPSTDYMTKITTLAAAGTLGDAFETFIFGTMYPFANAGVQLPVDDLLVRDKIDRNRFFPGPLNVLTWDGKLQALPHGAHPGYSSFYVNTDEFEKAGVPLPTWEWTFEKEFLDAVRKVHDSINKQGGQKRFGVEVQYVAQQALLFIRSWGGDWIDPATRTKSMINTPETTAALAFMRDLVVTHKVAPKKEEIVAAAFENQFLGSRLHGNWWADGYTKTIATKFKWKSLAAPAGPGGRGTFVGADSFPINRKSKNPDAAWEFVKFMVFHKDGIALGIPNGQSPSALKEVWTQAPLSTDPNWEASRKWMEVATGWTAPKNARAAEMNRVFNSGLEAILKPETDFKTAIADLHKNMQALLDMPPA